MSGTTVWTVERLQKEFENLGYNMLDCKIAASTALADPGKAYKALKVRSKQALTQGRDSMIAGKNETANNNFAFAYQMRCVCHWIWKNLLGRTGDNGHQAFLTLSRKFSQLANGKLTGAQKQEVESMVEKIKGTDR